MAKQKRLYEEILLHRRIRNLDHGAPIYLINKYFWKQAVENNVWTIGSLTGLELDAEKNPDIHVLDFALKQQDYDRGYNEEYFQTPIAGKRVFCHIRSYDYLPTYLFSPYRVYEKDDTDIVEIAEDGSRYVEVFFGDETTIGDLYKRAYMYQFSFDGFGYYLLPPGGIRKNMVKSLLYSSLTHIGGNVLDHIADLNKLVAFLLQKAELSEQERLALSPLLERDISADDLLGYASRQKFIRDYIAQALDDVDAYLTTYDWNF